MHSTLTRRGFVRAAASLILTGCALAPLTPALAKKKIDPNSPKGKWTGTYQTPDGTESGSVTLTITTVKKSSAASVRVVRGSLKFGSSAARFAGTYDTVRRLLVGGQIKAKGTVASLAVNLSADGHSLNGTWASSTFPGGGDAKAGTTVLSR